MRKTMLIAGVGALLVWSCSGDAARMTSEARRALLLEAVRLDLTVVSLHDVLLVPTAERPN